MFVAVVVIVVVAVGAIVPRTTLGFYDRFNFYSTDAKMQTWTVEEPSSVLLYYKFKHLHPWWSSFVHFEGYTNLYTPHRVCSFSAKGFVALVKFSTRKVLR